MMYTVSILPAWLSPTGIATFCGYEPASNGLVEAVAIDYWSHSTIELSVDNFADDLSAEAAIVAYLGNRLEVCVATWGEAALLRRVINCYKIDNVVVRVCVAE